MRHGPTDGWCLPLDAAEGGRFLLFLSGAPVLPEAVCLSVCLRRRQVRLAEKVRSTLY